MGDDRHLEPILGTIRDFMKSRSERVAMSGLVPLHPASEPGRMPGYLTPRGEVIVKNRLEPWYSIIIEGMLDGNGGIDEEDCHEFLALMLGPTKGKDLFVLPEGLLVPSFLRHDGKVVTIQIVDPQAWLIRCNDESVYRMVCASAYKAFRPKCTAADGMSPEELDRTVLAGWWRGYRKMRRRVRWKSRWAVLKRRVNWMLPTRRQP